MLVFLLLFVCFKSEAFERQLLGRGIYVPHENILGEMDHIGAQVCCLVVFTMEMIVCGMTSCICTKTSSNLVVILFKPFESHVIPRRFTFHILFVLCDLSTTFQSFHIQVFL